MISISDLLLWRKCELAGVAKFMHNRWHPPGEAFGFGNLMHQYMHHLWHPLALHPCSPRPPLPEPPPGMEAQFDALCTATAEIRLPGTFHIHSLERPVAKLFRSPGAGGGFILCGRLDGLGEEDGEYWSIQYKSIAWNRSIGLELERVRVSPHESAYAALLEYETGIRLAGTLLLVYRKPMGSRAAGGTTPAGGGWSTHRLYRQPEFSLAVLRRTVLPWARRFVGDLSLYAAGGADDGISTDTTACFGPFGNGPTCPLIQRCHGVVPDSRDGTGGATAEGAASVRDILAMFAQVDGTAGRYPEVDPITGAITFQA